MKLFVHIPKTAGTSFRWALEKYFTEQQVIRDYGPDAPETSEIVQKYIYRENEPGGTDELIRVISGTNAKILLGHFPLQKYARYFEPQNVITFVRQPLIRICSEYLHRIENGTFKRAFPQFVETSGFQNMQSKFLEGICTESMVGITEHYRESLHKLNSVFGWKLKARKKNVLRNKGGAGVCR